MLAVLAMCGLQCNEARARLAFNALSRVYRHDGIRSIYEQGSRICDFHLAGDISLGVKSAMSTQQTVTDCYNRIEDWILMLIQK